MRNSHSSCHKSIQGIGAGVVLGFVALLTSGCAGTIHTPANIGGVDTLSLDAKQRLMLVSDRYPTRHGEELIRVACTEPSPDALVARAAIASGNASVSAPTGGDRGTGSFLFGTSESAASIGYRDHTIQMLRDGYFRMCEAYMNGALSKDKYEHMITNTDTFLAVVSALQVLGPNPVAPNLIISGGDIQIDKEGITKITNSSPPQPSPPTPKPPGESNNGDKAKPNPAPSPSVNTIAPPKPTGEVDTEKAKMIRELVGQYLDYRERMNNKIYVTEICYNIANPDKDKKPRMNMLQCLQQFAANKNNRSAAQKRR